MPVHRIARFFSDLVGRCMPAQGGTGLDASSAANGQSLIGTGTGLALIRQRWSLRAGGATGDGATDDTAAISAVLTAAGAAGGGVVDAEPGRYRVSAPLAAPAGVTLRGAGRFATIFAAAPGFAGPQVTLDSFGCRLENCQVDCGGVAASVGVFSNSINEQSGLFNVLVVNFCRSGLRVDGTGSGLFPQNWNLHHSEFYMDSATTYPTPSCIELVSTFPSNFGHLTLNATVSGGVPAGSAGVRIGTNTGSFSMTDVHGENLVTVIDGLSYGCTVDRLTVGPNVTTGVRVAAGANNFSVRAATPSGSMADMLTDADRGSDSGNVPVLDYAIAGVGLPAAVYGGTVQVVPSTSREAFSSGTLGLQQFGPNNSWIADNLFFSGSTWTYKQAGPGLAWHFQGTRIELLAAPAGAAGAAATPASVFTLTAAGVVAADGSGLTNLNASNLAGGTMPAARLPATGLALNEFSSAITTDADAATITFDCSVSNWHQVTLGGNRTLALSNVTVGQQITLKIIQAASGGPFIPDWFPGITWYTTTFSAPTMPTTASKAMVVTIKCVGTGSYDGFPCGTSGT